MEFFCSVVVAQFYETDVIKEFAIRGNAAVLKCQVPSFVADFVSVVSWHIDEGDDFYPSSDFGNDDFPVKMTLCKNDAECLNFPKVLPNWV